MLYAKFLFDSERKEIRVLKIDAFTDVDIPHADELPAKFKDTTVYERDMNGVEPCKHDVALFLHCLTDQVEKNLVGAGGSGSGSTTAATSEEEEIALEKYLEQAYCATVTEDDPDVDKIKQAATMLDGADNALAEPDLRVRLVSGLDRAMVKHLGQKNAANVTKVYSALKYLSQFHNPQTVTIDGKLDYLGLAERSAHRNRIYPFFNEDDWTIVEIERLLLLFEFEQLLKSAQPERSYELHKTRLFHEKIPKALFTQTLHKCLSENNFALDSKYYPRHDAVLLALHNRAVAGRSTWFRWADCKHLTSKSAAARALTDARQKCKEASAALANFRNPPPPPDANPGKKKKGLVEEPVEKKRSPEEEAIFKAKEAKLLAVKDFWRAQLTTLQTLAENVANLDENTFGQLEETEKMVLPADGSLITFSDYRRGIKDRNTAPGAAEEIFSGENGAFSFKQHRVSKDGVYFAISTNDHFERRKPQAVEILAAADSSADAKRRAADAEAAAADGREVEEDREYPPTEYGLMRDAFSAQSYGNLSIAFAGHQSRVFVSCETERANLLGKVALENLHRELFPEGEEAEKPDAVEVMQGSEWTGPPGELNPQNLEFEYKNRPTTMSYTLEDSQKIEINADGSCFVHWPVVTGNSKASSSSSSSNRCAGSDGSHYEAGQVEDTELSRRIQPDGTMLRFLKSGRIELYYADGTVAYRNPTAEELAKVPVNGSEWLAHLQLSYGSRDSCDEDAIQAGLPGHWVGRVDVSLLPPAGEPGDGADGEAPPPDEELPEGTGRVERNLRTVLEEKGCVLTDDGTKVEYSLKPISTVTQQDPHTGYYVTTSQTGLMMIESEDRTQRRLITKDATVITWQHTDTDKIFEVVVEKPDVMPKVIVTQDNYSLQKNTKMDIFLSDGSKFEVCPKELKSDGSASLVPCPMDRIATHNTVVFRHNHSKSVLRSNGLGQVDIFTSSDIAQQGEQALLSAVD
eukprot:g2257.t1